MQPQYTVKVRPVGKPRIFSEIEVGEAFTELGDIGMSNLFTGFSIYLKLNGESSRRITDGRVKVFAAEHPVMRILICEVSE
jgi:hypothetical protein